MNYLFLLLGFFSVFTGAIHADELSLVPAERLISLKKKYKERKAKKNTTLDITGCARSGTTYIVEVLQKCGYDVQHEKTGTYGTVSWTHAVDDKWTCCGRGTYWFKFKHVFHQVRDPLKTMSSCTTEPSWSWRFICKHIPEIQADEPLTARCAKYWYYWNLRAEKKAEWTYRIEDIENALEEMGRRLGIHLDASVLQHVPKNVNSRQRKIEYTWADIKEAVNPDLYKKIVELARRYGYDIQEE